ncbi:MAG: DUF255 domain-containing protein, partial [Bacteroidota bacterium]
MRTQFTYLFLLSLTILGSFSSINAQSVNWITWEEAVTLAESESNTKKIFVDVYTDWCGWCKKMDKDTFQN